MNELTDFLLARIAEDEAAAHEVESDFAFDPSEPLYSPLDVFSPGYDMRPVISIERTRVLAECAAKRAIVDLFRNGAVGLRFDGSRWVNPLEPLAAVYKDHSDYREEWRRE